MKMQTFLFLVTFLFISCKQKSNIEIANAMLDGYSAEMILIDNKTPKFSWQLISNKNGANQSAYQIQVFADDEEKIWDTDKTKSSQSLQVRYNGKELKSANKYFWRVRVWDENGLISNWSELSSFQLGLLLTDDWNDAKWIGYKQLDPNKRMPLGVTGYGKESENKVEERAIVPIFRKTFNVSKKIQSATLFITGLGQYEASINGRNITNAVFTPSWSNYDKTVYYNAYDITENIINGKNVIATIVGNGFHYNNRERYRKLIIAFGFPRMICNLQIKYTDGSISNIVTDDTWKTSPSPITYSGIYGGEDYDARLEISNWNEATLNDETWENAKIVESPSGILCADINNPIKIMEIFEPIAINAINDSTIIYDFGQNASANIAITLNGKSGKEVRFYPSECIKESGEINQKGSGSPYYYSYTLKGKENEAWAPRFSYYGFRYVEARGVNANGNRPDLPEVISINSRHIRNSAKQLGTFSSSNELFNKTFNLINWGIKSNLQSVMTDCPTREKLGWIEQTQLMGTSVHYNFDLYHLYQKLLRDMSDAQTKDGLVPNIVPEYINFEYYDVAFRDSPEWGSASIILPYMIYKWYGDIHPLEKSWKAMNRYMNYLQVKSKNYILSHGLGDWYDIGTEGPGYAQLTSVPLVATATYFYDAQLMSKMAKILNDNLSEIKYKELADSIKNNFNSRFYRSEAAIYGSGSQTALAMPLSMGIINKENEQEVLNNLVAKIKKDKKSITAGDVGFHYLIDALTKYAKSDLIYEMNNRDDVPGYGYQLKQGATSLAESWQALHNKSMNHLMLGHLMEWFYKGLGGINQKDESLAYKDLLIKPIFVDGISNLDVTLNTPYGLVETKWKKIADKTILNVLIPVNSTAKVELPKTAIITKGKCISQDNSKKENTYFEITSGRYRFEIRN